ncbi:hypothetical protein K440DRAFT_608783, partial [Wilcoxina mikolae CBS 423.85]
MFEFMTSKSPAATKMTSLTSPALPSSSTLTISPASPISLTLIPSPAPTTPVPLMISGTMIYFPAPTASTASTPPTLTTSASTTPSASL